MDCLSQKKPGATGKPGFSQQTSADSLDLPPVIQPAIGSGRSNRGTFLCHLQLFRMTIQQDPYEDDPWWFAPLLYAGAAVVIAAFVLV